MTVHVLPSQLRIKPPFPVEQAMAVDGTKVWVAIEWPVIERWLGPRANDADAVREALHERRLEIERTVEAHVFAHGLALSKEVSLTVEDFKERVPRR
ncbi:MAG TPA: hypothetical protein VMN56_02300 [Casimicrobiaceae bacterium]|nr:hypothetical protein [Casimicrobiaceae bacterium]